MLRPDDIRTEANRLWYSGRLLRAWLGVEELFPWTLLLELPPGGRMLEDLAAVRAWKKGIEAGCKCAGGEGYRIEYRVIEHPRLGHRRLPERVVFDTPMDLVGYLGRGRELADFVRLARAIRSRFPALGGWIEGAPMQVLEHGEEWPRLLQVLDWLVDDPRPDHPIREPVIPGVDGEFVAEHKRLLADLLVRLEPLTATDRLPHEP